MKLILFFCINTAFADVLSDWIDSNSHIINSKSYKISFKQRFETTIENSVHYSTIPADFVYLNNTNPHLLYRLDQAAKMVTYQYCKYSL